MEPVTTANAFAAAALEILISAATLSRFLAFVILVTSLSMCMYIYNYQALDGPVA
jgi:hypothetical protein